MVSVQGAGHSQEANAAVRLVSDAERDVAVRHLQRHYVEGRLTLDELDERVGLALAARTIGDLAAARLDLPESAAPGGGDPDCDLPRKALLTRHRVKIATAAALLTGVSAWWFS